jgi:hypothetical protein
MSDNPSKDSHASVADASLKSDNVHAPEAKQNETSNALRRAVKTWLDMLVASTSRRS